jgi:hypothetical protein
MYSLANNSWNNKTSLLKIEIQIKTSKHIQMCYEHWIILQLKYRSLGFNAKAPIYIFDWSKCYRLNFHDRVTVKHLFGLITRGWILKNSSFQRNSIRSTGKGSAIYFSCLEYYIRYCSMHANATKIERNQPLFISPRNFNVSVLMKCCPDT